MPKQPVVAQKLIERSPDIRKLSFAEQLHCRLAYLALITLSTKMTSDNSVVHYVAIAILYRGNRFLMQLRDDNPQILYPGYWTMFGGHIEPGETPDVAMKRELQEEIGHAPATVTLFKHYQVDDYQVDDYQVDHQQVDQDKDPLVSRYVFCAPLGVDLDALVLGEGWDMGLLSVADIERGNCYSAKAEQVRPIGTPHRKILLDFIQAHPTLLTEDLLP